MPSGACVAIPGENSVLTQFYPNSRDVTVWQLAGEVTSVPEDTYDTVRLSGANWYRIDVTFDIRPDTRFSEVSLSSNYTDAALLMSLPEVFSRLTDAADAAFSTIECEAPPDLIEDGRCQPLGVSQRDHADENGSTLVDDWVDAVVAWQSGDRDDGIDTDRIIAEHATRDQHGSPVKSMLPDVMFLASARYQLWLAAVCGGLAPDQLSDRLLERDLPQRIQELFDELVSERVKAMSKADSDLRESPDETRHSAERYVASVLQNEIADPLADQPLPASLPDSTEFELQPTCVADEAYVTAAGRPKADAWSAAQGLYQSGQRVAALFELAAGLQESARLLMFCAETDERSHLQSTLKTKRE